MRNVVVVGGGITGLACAHALERAALPADAKVFEGSTRLGGNIFTLSHNGFVIDAGPDSWVAAKPHATRLAREVGLGNELIGTRDEARKVFIVWKGQLHPMPAGSVLGIPTEWKPFATTTLFGLDAKARAGLDLIVPKKHFGADEDESIGAFVSRRLGSEMAERLVSPLLGGIFAGDADQLSVRACIPQLFEAEQKHGSLIRAMRALRAARKTAAASGGEGSAFTSLERGVGDLVVNVAHKLAHAEVMTGAPALGLSPLAPGDPRGRWTVATNRGSFHADDVVLSVPAHAASRLVSGFDAQLASMLGVVPYVSTATVFLACRRADIRHPLDAVGFLVPKSENRRILACTFVSSKWDHRAPAGQVLLRVFIGGANAEHLLERDDDGLVSIAREELLALMGVDRAPSFTRVFRHKGASPQPVVGHLGRMKKILARVGEHPGLYVGGNGYVGTGIPDAIKQGEEIAARIVAEAKRSDQQVAPLQPASS